MRDQFQIFSPSEVASLRKGGAILRECLTFVSGLVRPGVSTLSLDQAAEEFIRSRGGVPAFKGYQGFPATLCASVNDEVVHGIPRIDRVLRDGQIISLDCGVLFDGLYTDACLSVSVGSVSPKIQRFLNAVSVTLEEVIQDCVRPGAHVGDISAAIERQLKKGGYAPVGLLTGHGLGTHLHQFPDVPNIGKPGTGPILPKGTMIAIEPIATMGKADIFTALDQWTVLTVDHSLAGHFEHSVLITETGSEIIA
jgi:methionyl aminopeptidase